MDPSKDIGKIKEQVEREHVARRNYTRKWGKLVAPEVTKFYNQNEIDQILQKTLIHRDPCPFEYTGEGESYFVSRDMYESLCSKCRCGRKRRDAHLLRCVQKEVDRFNLSEEKEEKSENHYSLPATSNGAIGFIRKKPIYQKWEQSMRYISPVYTMPGFRVTATPYNAIIIG